MQHLVPDEKAQASYVEKYGENKMVEGKTKWLSLGKVAAFLRE